MQLTRSAHRLEPRDGQRIERIDDCLEVTRRQLQIDDGVPDLGMPEEELDRSNVRPRF
jgi:hypothetical protein